MILKYYLLITTQILADEPAAEGRAERAADQPGPARHNQERQDLRGKAQGRRLQSQHHPARLRGRNPRRTELPRQHAHQQPHGSQAPLRARPIAVARAAGISTPEIHGQPLLHRGRNDLRIGHQPCVDAPAPHRERTEEEIISEGSGIRDTGGGCVIDCVDSMVDSWVIGSQREFKLFLKMTEREKLIQEYAAKKITHDQQEESLRKRRFEVRDKKKEVIKTDNQLKSLQSVGQIIGEVLKEITTEKYIVKSSTGTRNVVGVKVKIDRSKLVVGARVALDQTTLTIMQVLPREVDPLVFNMMNEDPGKVDFSDIGGLGDQLRVLRETIELPIINPELFMRVGIKPPKGCLMYGPPGTGKTLIARALASNIEAKFLKVVASAIVDKYIGESARVIREMFAYAKENQPCIIFMDEIDAIGGRRFSEGSSADREVQRTLMELLNQLDGFDELGRVKVVMATNRPDILDPALLRPGRLDRKVEIPLPNEAARQQILKIHSKGITTKGEIDFEALSKICEEFNGADLRNVCTEGGMFAIREDREYVIDEDLMKAARKIRENKKLESKLDYTKM